MKQPYHVEIRGRVPDDLAEMISRMHASAILRNNTGKVVSRNETDDLKMHRVKKETRTSKALRSVTDGVKGNGTLYDSP